MVRKSYLCSLFVFFASIAHGESDTAGIDNMCLSLSSTTTEQCQCATESLASSISAKDLEFYAAVSASYLADPSRTKDAGEAWDKALRAHKGNDSFIAALERANAVGNAHHEAIETCAG